MFTDLRQLLSGVARMKTIQPVAKIHLVAETRILLMTGTVNKGKLLNYKKHIILIRR